MKKIIAILMAVLCIVSFAACSKDDDAGDENSSGGNIPILGSSDLQVQTITIGDRLVTVEKINSDGTITLVNWSKSKNDKGEYELTKQSAQKINAKIDENTEILMGDIMSYDGSIALSDYDKTTTLEYFKENATKAFHDRQLYFEVAISDNYISKIQLFWDLYFVNK